LGFIMYYIKGMKIYIKLSFNPFWDLSLFGLFGVEAGGLIFQSLLGFIVRQGDLVITNYIISFQSLLGFITLS